MKVEDPGLALNFTVVVLPNTSPPRADAATIQNQPQAADRQPRCGRIR